MGKKIKLSDRSLKDLEQRLANKKRILNEHERNIRRLEREINDIDNTITIKKQEAEILELKKLAGKK